jgi:hypothetical protein
MKRLFRLLSAGLLLGSSATYAQQILVISAQQPSTYYQTVQQINAYRHAPAEVIYVVETNRRVTHTYREYEVIGYAQPSQCNHCSRPATTQYMPAKCR